MPHTAASEPSDGIEAAAVGLVLVVLTSAVLDQRPGISGLLDRLAALDGTAAGSQWWALPLPDVGALLVALVAVGAAVLLRRRRAGAVGRVLGTVAGSIAWLGCFLAVSSLAAGLLGVLNPATATLPWPWVWAALAVTAVVVVERSLHDRAAGPARPVRGLRSGAVAGVAVVVAGAAGPGLVPVAVLRLALEPLLLVHEHRRRRSPAAVRPAPALVQA